LNWRSFGRPLSASGPPNPDLGSAELERGWIRHAAQETRLPSKCF
jgi:hypothetical protein